MTVKKKPAAKKPASGRPAAKKPAAKKPAKKAAAKTPEPEPPTTYELPGLPPELVDGLTTWGTYGGAQIRIESPFLLNEAGEPIRTDNGLPALAPPIGCLYIAFNDNAVQSDEEGHPYRLNLRDARTLRDLLNIATARGVL